MKKDRRIENRRLRNGLYSILICIVMAAVMVGINLFVSVLPQQNIRIDTTAQGLYSLSEQTRSVLQNLEEDVELYLISEPGKEDNYTVNLLDRYADLSDHIHVQQINPLTNPMFTSAYSEETVENNSVIAVSAQRSKVVSSTDMYSYGFDYDYYTNATVFNGEALLTNAVRYVTDPEVPAVYLLTGHGELSLPETLSDALTTENIDIRELNLVTEKTVPEDAMTVVIFSPASDITDQEKDELLSFSDRGGGLILVSGYSAEDRSNLYALTASFGMEPEKGVILENDERHSISGYAFYLLPDIEEHEITDPILKAGQNILTPVVMGIRENSHRSTLAVAPLLTTSESAYLKTDPDNTSTYEMEEGDLAGEFTVAAASEETYNDTTVRMLWFASDMMFTEQADTIVSGSNTDLFINAVFWAADRNNDITVRAKSTMMPYLTVTTAFRNTMMILTAVVLPLAAVAAGIVILIRRRRAS